MTSSQSNVDSALAHAPIWEQRMRAGRVGLPDWADDAPQHCVVAATTPDGVLEIHCWDAGSGPGGLRQVTSRTEGTSSATISPDGLWVWWFDDTDGDELGVWRRQPYGTGPGGGVEDATGLPAAYSAGLALGRGGLAVVGGSDDEHGTRIHVLTRDVDGGLHSRLLYSHPEDAYVAGLSEDGSLVLVSHSEHGDSRHPALRCVRTCDGSTVAEVWDGPGKGVASAGFAPALGDGRALVLHERRGFGELLIWDVLTGTQHELVLPIPGEVADADWSHDGRSALVLVDHQARTRAHEVELASAVVEPLFRTHGTVHAATTLRDHGAWLLWSSGSTPPAVWDPAGDLVLTPPGNRAPPSVDVEDVWAPGAGGSIHALLRRPRGDIEPLSGPLPLVIDVHGGPTAHDADSFRPLPAAWVDHGFAHLQVNYRGSTGYGSSWRDALEARIGHIELEDVVAVRDHLVATGVADPGRVVLSGASWGGYLTLLGLGLYPDRWAVGLAAVPVADYVAAYEDEMEALKAFDRSLFGGSPDQVPHRYRDSSPLTYVDQVTAPVLILAGENDPRCPIRQIENYLGVLVQRGMPHELYRFDAGHGSLVDDERVRQTRAELGFVARHLPSTATS